MKPLITPTGDHAITATWGDKIDVGINRKVISVFTYIQQHPPEGLRDVVPAYHSLTLIYDTASLKKKNPLASVYEQMKIHLENAIAQAADVIQTSSIIDIPVCYDISLGPDLPALSAMHQLSVQEIISLHTSPTYHVYLVGFMPGFAYMGSVHEKIRSPRRPAPRTHVPAGSVGIAGEQTGIYPFSSPGGWQLVGQTPVQMFDASLSVPCYLKPGDAVRFHEISLDEFNKRKSA